MWRRLLGRAHPDSGGANFAIKCGLSRTLGDRRELDRGSASQTRCEVCQTVATYLESTSAGRGPKYLDSFGPSSPKVRESPHITSRSAPRRTERGPLELALLALVSLARLPIVRTRLTGRTAQDASSSRERSCGSIALIHQRSSEPCCLGSVRIVRINA